MIGSDDFGRYSGAGRSRSFNMGGMLVGIGVLFLLWQLLSPTGALPLLILGGIFTGLALLKGIRGFTMPGGILLGLAGGLIVASLLRHVSGAFGGAAVLVGLGAGFWLIPTLDRLRHPYSNAFGWARIPGTILFCIAALPALIGTLSVAGRSLGFLLQFWPIFLIVGGLWLFFSNRRRGRARWS